jgi:serine/threonine-protein kinase
MTTPALLGTLLDGKFQIEKVLGSGASGDVYEALHVGLGKRVAVKVLRPGEPETAGLRRKRFQREAKVAARVQSQHVVTVFDIVAPEGGPTYIVMELLRGETLAERVKRVGRVPVEEAVDYVFQAASALAAMHDAGIVHRDVNPSNMFIARNEDGSSERVKLIDFGVAAFCEPLKLSPLREAGSPRTGESALTHAESILGTPRYMAPEQVESSKGVDGRADLWALGVTLYSLIAGRPPFDASSPYGLIHQVAHDEPPLLNERCPDVPRGLATLVHRCLAKERASRPADARELARLLDPFRGPLSGTSADVARPTATERSVLAVAAVIAVGSLIAIVAALRVRPPSPATQARPAPTPEVSAEVHVEEWLPPPPAPLASTAPASTEPARKVAPPARRPSPRPTTTGSARLPWEKDDRLE